MGELARDLLEGGGETGYAEVCGGPSSREPWLLDVWTTSCDPVFLSVSRGLAQPAKTKGSINAEKGEIKR